MANVSCNARQPPAPLETRLRPITMAELQPRPSKATLDCTHPPEEVPFEARAAVGALSSRKGALRQAEGADPHGARYSQTRRRSHTNSWKLEVVAAALKRPKENRIKPVCRLYPHVTPVQLRKWIRNRHELQKAKPTARALPRRLKTTHDDCWQMVEQQSELREGHEAILIGGNHRSTSFEHLMCATHLLRLQTS